MAKFINKKEQVFDLQLTPYARYLMSIGKFNPAFYAFFDDNVIYDRQYAYSTTTESQSNVDTRIKEDTSYLGGLVLFRDVEKTKNRNADTSIDFVLKPSTGRTLNPDTDSFRVENAIGDAYLDGPAQAAPSWKVVALSSLISSSATFDSDSNSRIPQVNITSTYVKKVVNNDFIFDPDNLRGVASRSPGFSDQKSVELVSYDPMLYIEEVNTRTLMKNFDIEVYEVETESTAGSHSELKRLNFRRQTSNVENGFLVSEAPTQAPNEELTEEDVEYYFDVLFDGSVNQRIACKGLNVFNKDAYYIDIDFDCLGEDEKSYYNDIYGSTIAEPEICQN
jgi:hypothetical protein